MIPSLRPQVTQAVTMQVVSITHGVVVLVYQFVPAVPVDPEWLRNKVETKHWL